MTDEIEVVDLGGAGIDGSPQGPTTTAVDLGGVVITGASLGPTVTPGTFVVSGPRGPSGGPPGPEGPQGPPGPIWEFDDTWWDTGPGEVEPNLALLFQNIVTI